MPGFTWMDAIPLWAFFPLTVAVVHCVIELGYRLGRFRRDVTPDEKEAPVGAMSAAALGLLAFFLAFTFGFTGARFEERRSALIDEVNAIGTCFLRSQTLPPDQCARIQTGLRKYVEIRMNARTPETMWPAIQESEKIHDQLWAFALRAAETDRSAVTALFISSLNDVIDLHTKRVTFGLQGRLPGIVWLALVVVTVLSMGVLGYLEGLSRSRRSPALIAVVLTFSTILTLVADLDRPTEGTLRIGPQLMIDLGRKLQIENSAP
ncbi:hypothetical protein Pan44_51140 [Caulifigura coniformis]|uniref:DUF4239 domain-containing protein n=1 Tax=Caulifigura coniformis TaxID=2527983 RepID=A0A517SLQ1_9PLAN|nr:DUF4239 domain-containing protein [Caulifigura coniformis]QDT57049.1 hypothetical protein Pan44_51140 [Caulifigura coniformis]